MEIQNFQKFLGRPLVFLKFWILNFGCGHDRILLFNKLSIKSLFSLISGHVFSLGFCLFSIILEEGIFTRNTEKFVENQGSP